MRTTFFNEPVFQPGDDFTAGWLAKFDDEPDAPVARFIEEDDDAPTFGCEITDNADSTAYAEGFATEADLRAWLTSFHIEIED